MFWGFIPIVIGYCLWVPTSAFGSWILFSSDGRYIVLRASPQKKIYNFEYRFLFSKNKLWNFKFKVLRASPKNLSILKFAKLYILSFKGFFSKSKTSNLTSILFVFYSMVLIFYSLCFILSIILTLCTQINETINFVYFLYKNTITYKPNHISTNRKINYCIKLINFALKIKNDTYFVTKKFLYNDI